MNTTRIEVPVTLPEPHFDDEATIATARQVVPIERARTIEFWRKLRTMLPIFLAATLCGALGAGAVNYYERRHKAAASAEQQSANNAAPVPAKSEPTPVAIAASTDANGGKTANDSVSKDNPSWSEKESAAIEVKATEPASSDNSPAKPDKKISESDATKLTRQRRVHPADREAPAKNNGAGRITDIFSGPNP